MTARPFLRWVGGKARLCDEILALLPERIEDYYEPFLGAGAVFFALAAAGRIKGTAYLSDANAELIVTHRTVRDHVEALIERLQWHEARHSTEYYYDQRAVQHGLTSVEASARFIYLNKVCFNGLYRVNRAGKFNVPIGKLPRGGRFKIVDAENLRACSRVLQGVGLSVAVEGDPVCAGALDAPDGPAHDRAKSGDAVYFDPPYFGHTSFVNYTPGGFYFEAQRSLEASARALRDDGVSVLLSNSDTPEMRALYAGWAMRAVACRRDVGRSNRHAVSELLIGGVA